MNIIIYSPLEQFEFVTIGIISEFGQIKLNVLSWLHIIDNSIIIQTINGIQYNNNIVNSPSIIIEGFSNIAILEIFNYIKNILEVYNNNIKGLIFKPQI